MRVRISPGGCCQILNEEDILTSTDEVEFEACPEPAQSVATLPTEPFRVDMVAADMTLDIGASE